VREADLRFEPDHLWIVDDVFALRPGWLEEFAGLVEEQRARIPFRCQIRADQVRPEFARRLAAAGCESAWIGAESGSQRVLDAMEKGIEVEQVRNATRLLRAAGVRVCWFLQFGYPGEDWSDVEATLALVEELEPDDIGVSVSYPLPGTPFYERVKADLGAKRNWDDSDDLAVMFRARYEPGFYRALHELVHRRFRARRAERALARLARRPWQARPGDLRRAAAWAHHRLRIPFVERRLARLRGRETPAGLRTEVAAVLDPASAARPSRQEEWGGEAAT
jgi:anaerobic magnesium-protoporphyrin IX monomethyl ester cyclase